MKNNKYPIPLGIIDRIWHLPSQPGLSSQPLSAQAIHEPLVRRKKGANQIHAPAAASTAAFNAAYVPNLTNFIPTSANSTPAAANLTPTAANSVDNA